MEMQHDFSNTHQHNCNIPRGSEEQNSVRWGNEKVDNKSRDRMSVGGLTAGNGTGNI
jgi:hypothetical protein